MTLNGLIDELQHHLDTHGDDEVSYDVGKDRVDILIGEDPTKGVMVTILKPDW